MAAIHLLGFNLYPQPSAAEGEILLRLVKGQVIKTENSVLPEEISLLLAVQTRTSIIPMLHIFSFLKVIP